MNTISATAVASDTPLADRLIRDLVEAYPQTLAVLGPLGIDLCGGGGHPLGEALDLHGLDRATILPQIARAIAGSEYSDRVKLCHSDGGGISSHDADVREH